MAVKMLAGYQSRYFPGDRAKFSPEVEEHLVKNGFAERLEPPKPVEPPESVEPSKPVEPPESVEPSKPVEPLGSVKTDEKMTKEQKTVTVPSTPKVETKDAGPAPEEKK